MKGFVAFCLIYLLLGVVSAMIFSRCPALFEETEPTWYKPGDEDQNEAALSVLLWWLMWLAVIFMWLKDRAWKHFCMFTAWLLFPHKPEPKPEPRRYEDDEEVC